jgi:hypothetical protein
LTYPYVDCYFFYDNPSHWVILISIPHLTLGLTEQLFGRREVRSLALVLLLGLRS